ncbi:uncharacterized protein [Populus alba]|uniref:uncharacterized protein n=1 Tax=Populus alba TaxID=43335 RepID=UPI0015895AEC|nr:uncharacterized protein LOC118047626 [Populus alba]
MKPDAQLLSLDRKRPRDLNRLLVNFQPWLHVITVIATESTSMASDTGTEGVEVLVRVFITFVSYAQVDEYLFLVLFTEVHGKTYRVLVNRLISQLREGNPSELPHLATSTHGKARDGTGSRGQLCRVNVSEQPSDHTRIWSKLSGSAAISGSGAEARQAERDFNANEQRGIQRISTMRISKDTSAGENVAVDPCLYANCFCLFQYVTFSGLVILRALVS